MLRGNSKRKVKRGPLFKPTSLTINGKPYLLKDISDAGIGIVVGNSTHFHIGQRLEGIHLPLTGGDQRLAGVVVHLSESLEGLVCGIRYSFESDKDYDAAVAFRNERTREGD